MGLRQAAQAATHLSGFDAVFSSPLVRAHNTATIIADTLGVGPVLADKALMERDVGPWQGLTREEIEMTSPNFLDSGQRPDGYESDSLLLKRVLGTLDQITNRMEDATVLVVTHAGVIYTLESKCGEPIVRIPNLGGRWFDISKKGRMLLGKRVEIVPQATSSDLL